MTTLFGIEAVTAAELAELGYDRDRITVSDGQVVLDAGESLADCVAAVARLNIHLATAERVLLQLASFPAVTFEALFDATRALPWEDTIPCGYAFHINGYSRKSRLFGVPACQSLIKKAIVDRLLEAWHLPPGSQLPEDSAKGLIRIQFAIVADHVTLMGDTTGDGLHKRGYRPLQHEAPIRETLAAAILRLARYRPGGPEALLDPMCGSGTFLIEAALLAARQAPGLNRPFAGEQWPLIGKEAFDHVRRDARAAIAAEPEKPCIFGSDLSEQAVTVTRNNARRAGVLAWIRVRQADVQEIKVSGLPKLTGFERHLVVCNPPYGERLLDPAQAEQLYRTLSKTFLEHGKPRPGIRFFVITPFERFESLAGAPADKRRKLYNGMIKCTLYQYFRKRSPDT